MNKLKKLSLGIMITGIKCAVSREIGPIIESAQEQMITQSLERTIESQEALIELSKESITLYEEQAAEDKVKIEELSEQCEKLRELYANAFEKSYGRYIEIQELEKENARLKECATQSKDIPSLNWKLCLAAGLICMGATFCAGVAVGRRSRFIAA